MINRKIFSLFISFESVTLHQKSIQIIQPLYNITAGDGTHVWSQGNQR